MARDSKTQQVIPNGVLMERNHGSASFCQTFPFVSVGCPFNYQHYRAPDFELSTRKGPEDVAQIGLVRVLDSME